jgi:predicted ABC-type ATPase
LPKRKSQNKNKLQKRIRIFAGPNGSGKSSLYLKIKEEYDIRFGFYINPDNLYKELLEFGSFNGSKYNIKITSKDFRKFFLNSSWGKYIGDDNYNKKWRFKNNTLSFSSNTLVESDAAVLIDYIRFKLLAKGETFTYETVMSHTSKLDFIQEASEHGYKVYLYFISTESADINLNRIKLRVKKGGHNVPVQKVKSRYRNSLMNLVIALKYCYRSFLFDSTNKIKLIASVDPQKNLTFERTTIPRWVKKYVIERINREKK